jgi:hypothetical protein
LRVELTNHTGEKNHGETTSQEHANNPVREAPQLRVSKGSTGDIDSEDGQDNHELTSQKVAIEVVALVGKSSTLVSDGVRFLVELLVNRIESDQGSLRSLNHGEPADADNEGDKSDNGADLARELGALLDPDETHDQRERDDQKDRRVGVLEQSKRGRHLVSRRRV